MILDTSFLIDVLRGAESVVEWERRLDDRGGGTVTAISVMELWEGIHLADASEAEREKVRTLLEGLIEAPFDRESGMLAGELTADLTDRGTPIDVEDVVIAATALSRDEPVLTRNAADFRRVRGLDVETY